MNFPNVPRVVDSESDFELIGRFVPRWSIKTRRSSLTLAEASPCTAQIQYKINPIFAKHVCFAVAVEVADTIFE